MALKYKLGTAFLELKGHFFNIPNHRIPLHSAENLKINIIIWKYTFLYIIYYVLLSTVRKPKSLIVLDAASWLNRYRLM